MPGITRRPRIGIVDVTKIEEDENRKSNIVWCPNCEEAGAFVKMGPRIYLPEKGKEQYPVIIPADADDWLQCHQCGKIIAVHEARGEGELQIDSEFELIESPFDFGQAVMENVRPSRKVDKSKLQIESAKKRLRKQLAGIDPDIRKELLEGGEVIDYTSTK
jgi:hypothetical protein